MFYFSLKYNSKGTAFQKDAINSRNKVNHSESSLIMTPHANLDSSSKVLFHDKFMHL